MRTPGRIGLMFASLLGAAVLLASPVASPPAHAQQFREIGPLAAPSRAPIVAQDDANARIPAALTNWKVDSDGDIKICWPEGNCYLFSNANANNTGSYCTDITGNIAGLRTTLKESNPNERVYAEFTDCYRGIPGGYWHGKLCLTNNINNKERCGYVTELKRFRETN